MGFSPFFAFIVDSGHGRCNSLNFALRAACVRATTSGGVEYRRFTRCASSARRRADLKLLFLGFGQEQRILQRRHEGRAQSFQTVGGHIRRSKDRAADDERSDQKVENILRIVVVA